MSSFIYVFVVKENTNLHTIEMDVLFPLHVKIKSVIFDTAGQFFQV